MKTLDSVLLSLAIGFFIIGVHQLFLFSKDGNFMQGVLASYWIFMLCSLLLIAFRYRKTKTLPPTKNENPKKATKQSFKQKK